MSVNAEYASINGSMVIINGHLPLKEILATSDDYPKGWHEGNPGGLDAIDTDLAPANIKNGITIFGFVGTLTATLAEDTTATDVTDDVITIQTGGKFSQSVAATGEYILATITDTYDASSMAVAVSSVCCCSGNPNEIKIRLYMDGAQMAESAFIPVYTSGDTIVQIGTKALSGVKTCKVVAYNPTGSAHSIVVWGPNDNDTPPAASIGVGSIKAT